jgi:hypothetical protein
VRVFSIQKNLCDTEEIIKRNWVSPLADALLEYVKEMYNDGYSVRQEIL